MEEDATELLEDSASSWRKEALKVDGLTLMTRTEAEGALGTIGGHVERVLQSTTWPVSLALFLSGSRVVRQVRSSRVGPGRIGRKGS